MLQLMIDNKAAVLGLLLALSEVLSLVPGIKANGLFELIYNALKSVK